MSCKFHQLRDDIIDRVNAQIKKDIVVFNICSHHHLDLSYMFSKIYMEYYNKEEHKDLFEEAGCIVAEAINSCVEILKDHGNAEYKDLNNLVYSLVNRYFDIFEEKGNGLFGCTHCGPVMNSNFICEGDGTCFHICEECKNEFVENCKCKIGCSAGCTLKKCNNYEVCKKLIPAWVDTMNKSICFECKYTYRPVPKLSTPLGVQLYTASAVKVL
jgi:hypothetical protein